MSKQIEALKLALDALEYVLKPPTEFDEDVCQQLHDNAITAIKEALAEQQPVAAETIIDIFADHEGIVYATEFLPAGTKLYTSPQPCKLKNVMRVKRISDQSLELVFTSCAAASEFIVAHGIKE